MADARATIESLRAEIDDVDRRLLTLLKHRLLCVFSIARAKKKHGLPARDPERERALLERVPAGPLRLLYAAVVAGSRRFCEAVVSRPDDGRDRRGRP